MKRPQIWGSKLAKQLVCDACGRPTNRLVAKLFLAPRNGRNDHSNYTAHADIGECCAARITEQFKWQKRKKRGEGKRQQHAST